MAFLDKCHCAGEKRQSSILYSILKNDNQSELQKRQQQSAARRQNCSCGSERRVALRCPQFACKAASAVLVKTLKFVKNVPSFQELPLADQLLVLRGCWAPLLVLGLAQDRVDFEVTEAPEPSMLQRILTSSPEKNDEQQHQAAPSAADIHCIKTFLEKCWSLDICTKEYAYLKGCVLFNPDLPGLQNAHYIQGLQKEAQQALNEYIKMIHRGDQTRFTKLITGLSVLRSISASVVSELFFRPIIGTVSMDDMLLEMLYAKL
uniref:Dosage sensitive sex-reversal-adrenal hypoplasia congenital-critical region of X chromosome, gene 1 n=1 Tax=Latimeria menadoensis TaxID=106881 RepID=M5D623_LATME|nr:dosage sensitive sex-reversal-adrenal hypoplasia congenital-critical region of X chromosome, gene 1 [Latimeria menadoensis]